MKKVINQKLYNTETATLIHEWNNGCFGNDFNFCKESLYKTKNGAYFLAGSGGARSKYGKEDIAIYFQSYGSNNSGGSEDIGILTEVKAIEWLEEHNGTNALEEHFRDKIEEG